MANYFGKAENTAQAIVKAFEENRVPNALAQIFVEGAYERHIASYSFLNRFVVLVSGYSDAMGFKQWKTLGRNVKKGAKAVYILAPVLKKTGETYQDQEGKTKDVTICIGFKGIPVIGYEDTEGKELESDPTVLEFIDSLPLLNVAKAWGVDVGVYNGQNGQALGYYAPVQNAIKLGTKNLSTWAHELAHKADDKLGTLGNMAKSNDRISSEIVAEFAGAVLLSMIGQDEAADVGGCYEYVKCWAGSNEKKVEDACRQVITRVCKVVELILETSEELENSTTKAA